MIEAIGRILGIDYGEKRIGLAISDEERKFSFEFEIWSPEEFWERIESLIAEKEISKIVLGLPLNMSGEHTQKTAEVIAFSQQLQEKVITPVELVDERLSSKMATSISGSQKNIDSLAAQIFLENYLNTPNK